MRICICGWYCLPEFYDVLKVINSKYPVTIISHKDDKKFFENIGLPYEIIPNIGLEFGAYDYYLKKCWDKESDVLFLHDDTRIGDEKMFDKIANLRAESIDQAYLFKDEQEQVQNGGKHGRAIFIGSKLLTFMLGYECDCYECKDAYDSHNTDALLKGVAPHTGFWFDDKNEGHSSGKPPKGVRHYNEMIYHFHKYLGWVRDRKLGNEKMNLLHRIHFDELDCGRRGKFKK